MNRKRILMALSFGILCLALVYFFLHGGEKSKKNQNSSNAQPSYVGSNHSPLSARFRPETEEPATDPTPKAQAVKPYVERVLEDPQYDWKRPIEFYGKVVDEKGQSVPGAAVHFVWNDLSQEGTSKSDTQTDAEGLFSMGGKKGKRLYVRIEKPGYYSSRRQEASFEYANEFEDIFHVPNSEKPVIFRLRTKGRAEPMIKEYVKIPLPQDGRPIRFDLNLGKVSDDGQFETHVWKANNRDEITGKFDWRVTFKVHGGGLLETEEEFPFVAPEAGYNDKMDFTFPAAMENWTPEIEKHFFISFGEPKKYLRADLRLRAAGTQYYVEYWLNPSGSRNLEYDPAGQPTSNVLE